MKFVLFTKSESGDDYSYLIEHPQEPTKEELDWFLMENACDKDEDTVYEHRVDLVSLGDGEYEPIPAKPAVLKEFL
jgi:hypothetical protein